MQRFEAMPQDQQSYRELHDEIHGILHAKAKFKMTARIVGRMSLSKLPEYGGPQKVAPTAKNSSQTAAKSTESKACSIQ
jgi:hypothetical protein